MTVIKIMKKTNENSLKTKFPLLSQKSSVISKFEGVHLVVLKTNLETCNCNYISSFSVRLGALFELCM